MDTIFAQATAPGKAGVSVIRISGPEALSAAARLAGDLDAPGRSVRMLRTPDGEVLDEALVLTFAYGHSFTGETVVELHLHGSVAIVSAVLQELGGIGNLRPAEAGEFTRRALDAGRLDLAQVEGLADLIDAETEAQRRQAMRVFSGAVGERVDHWREQLIRAMALIEATIDFADEDVPVDVMPEVWALLSSVRADLERELAGSTAAERIRSGFEVAIVGAPNVGKSTLLNALVGRRAAITSERAGTTRDVIEVRMDIGGLAVTLLDTAGLREAEDDIEKVGIEWGLERAKQADLRIHLVPAGEAPFLEPVGQDIVAIAKADTTEGAGLAVSGRTGAGIDRLIGLVGERLAGLSAGAGIATRERHMLAMRRCLEGLEAALDRAGATAPEADLIAEDLRSAVRSIDSLVGRVDVDDVLGEIFKSFCIGK